MSHDVRVALIDDDAAVLESTALLLRGASFTVDCFGSAEAFLERLAADRMAPGCIVCDVRLPGMTGLALQMELGRVRAAIPVILITGHADVRMAVGAIKAGAFDFLEKPFEIDHLVRAIRLATDSARIESEMQREQADVAERMNQLSGRQREVMDLVVDGYSSRQIAAKLGISARTVETYRFAIMEKMGAGSVAALVRMVMTLGRTAAVQTPDEKPAGTGRSRGTRSPASQ